MGSGSLHIQLAQNTKFINAFAQRGAGDAEHFGGVHLVIVCLLERLDDQLALDGGDDFQFRIAFGPLEKLAGQRRGIRRGGVALDADVPPEEVERLVARSYALGCSGLTRKQKAELAGLSP